MSFTVVPSIVPTGGAIALAISSTASAGYEGLTLKRSADNGVTWTQIYSGDPTSLYLDVGDGLPTALNTSTAYMYWVQDSITPSVSAMTEAMIPASQLTVIQDINTDTWRKLLNSAVASLAIPDGYQRPRFLYQMPLDATPKLPFITMNLDLLQQEEIPIGFSIPEERYSAEVLAGSGLGIWTVQGIQNRRYSIYVMSQNYEEREYLQSAIIGTLFGLQGILAQGNQQIRFSYQATQGSIEGDEAQPGFYYSQIVLDQSHTSMIQIRAQTGVLSGIGVNVNSTITVSATVSSSGVFVED